jgi:hypothetical protein
MHILYIYKCIYIYIYIYIYKIPKVGRVVISTDERPMIPFDPPKNNKTSTSFTMKILIFESEKA